MTAAHQLFGHMGLRQDRIQNLRQCTVAQMLAEILKSCMSSGGKKTPLLQGKQVEKSKEKEKVCVSTPVHCGETVNT